MTRKKRWSDIEVSAYLDGALTPQDQATLETDMARDPDLRQRVEALRSVTLMVRAVPMRQTPRNYLLTAAMVAEKEEAKPAPRRRPLWAMRLATSLVAAAFVISFGLTMMGQGLSPSLMMQSEDAAPAEMMRESAPEGAPESDGVPMAAPRAGVEAEAEESAEVLSTVPVEALEAPMAAMEEEVDRSPEDTRTLTPMPDAGDAAPGFGVGGGAQEEAPAPLPPRPETPAPVVAEEGADLAASENAVAALEAPEAAITSPEEAAITSPEAAIMSPEAAITSPEGEMVEAWVETQDVTSGTEMEKLSGVDEAAAVLEADDGPAAAPPAAADPSQEGGEALGRSRRATSVGITIGLGLATALLAGLTIWFSRRQAS